jgi:hypothetical protein
MVVSIQGRVYGSDVGADSQVRPKARVESWPKRAGVAFAVTRTREKILLRDLCSAVRFADAAFATRALLLLECEEPSSTVFSRRGAAPARVVLSDPVARSAA